MPTVAKDDTDVIEAFSSDRFTAFTQFETPLDMLYSIDPLFISGKIELYPWQKQALVLISLDYDREKPLKFCLPAVNGSGKDYIVIAATSLWLTLNKVRHLTVITSASGNQLSGQTETYIRDLASKCNENLIPNMFTVNQRNITCTATGSVIKLFATDEPGKAEGYHPMDFDAEMAIIPNEAKSIPESIFKALNRCTGFTRWIEVSSPGKPKGHFYNIAKMAKDIKSFKNLREAQKYEGWVKRVVTVDDCPHISRSQMREDFMFYGETSAYCRSKYRAEFTTEEDQVVIEYDKMVNAYENPPKIDLSAANLRAGLDFGFGGDESVLSVWQGNKQIALEKWRIKDTVLQKDFILELLKTKYPKLEPENIFADDGNAGKSIIDMLVHEDFPINRILNQSAAINKKIYSNRGAEMYFNLAALVNQNLLCFINDDKQRDQLGNRHWRRSAMSGKIILVSKRDEKASGLSSPDRGDACVLANRLIKPGDLGGIGIGGKVSYNSGNKSLLKSITSTNRLLNLMHARRDAEANPKDPKIKKNNKFVTVSKVRQLLDEDNTNLNRKQEYGKTRQKVKYRG